MITGDLRNNIDGIFNGADGRQNVTFMCTTLPYGPYYWSEHFGAIRLGLEDYSTMWLFLPDQGTTPEELLSSGEIFEFLYTTENQEALVSDNPITLLCSKMSVPVPEK